MEPEQGAIHGRGASSNPPNRFELIHYERDETISEDESPSPATRFYRPLRHFAGRAGRNDCYLNKPCRCRFHFLQCPCRIESWEMLQEQ
jgi:hypothetical protein